MTGLINRAQAKKVGFICPERNYKYELTIIQETVDLFIIPEMVQATIFTTQSKVFANLKLKQNFLLKKQTGGSQKLHVTNHAFLVQSI
jgi:hypothetical protein